MDTSQNIPTPALDNVSSSEKRYFAELTRAMTLLGADPMTVFVGQAVRHPGTAMYGTLEGVALEKRIELPVAEEMQMGQSIGLALADYTVISLYPRFNFLLCAVNQLVNHLDKLIDMSAGGYRPRVIVRTAVGSVRPLDPQHQHRGNYASAFRGMLSSVCVIELTKWQDIAPAYEFAASRRDGRSTLMIEHADLYNDM
jgi:pyruvate/2-oxoglutarate/acetoin dehydrogenase E1 component